MQLLMEHLQKGKVFSLWAQYELTGQELTLVERYNIKRTVLVEGNPRQEKEWAVKMAGALAVVVAGLTFAFSTPADAVALGLITIIVVPFVIYYRIRETIRVEDILDGRHFACRSIITLLRKSSRSAR